MNLVIEIKNGKPVNHPIAEENLKVLIPDLDIDNLPEGYARFVRKPLPDLDIFQIIDNVNYVIDPVLSDEMNTTVWTDEYEVRDLIEEEILELVNNEIKLKNEKMEMDANAPYSAPQDGNLYVWSRRLNKWIVKPENFDQTVTKFAEELSKLGLAGLSPSELENIDADKKLKLEQIVDELNKYPGFEDFEIT